MNKFRVFHCIFELATGGAQRQLFYLLKYRSELFADATVLCIPTKDDYYEKQLLDLGVNIIHLPARSSCAVRYMEMTFQIFNHLRKSGPFHIVHNWMMDMNVCGAIAGTLARTPAVIAAVRVSPDHADAHWSSVSDPSNAKFILSTKIASRIVDATITNSNRLRDEYIKWAGIADNSAVVSIQNGIDCSLFCGEIDRAAEREALGIGAADPVVGIVERIAPEKDHQTFFEMAARIVREIPETRFLVVGYIPGDEQSDPARHFKKKLNQLGIMERVVFTGKSHRIKEMLAVMDVAVNTSIQEGFSNFILEAMAMGLPVAATDVSGSAEAVNHEVTGFIAPPRSPETLARHVVWLLQHPEVAARMGDLGKQRAVNVFDVKNMVQATENLYLQLLKKKGYC